MIPGGIRYRDRLQSMAVRSDAAGRLRITWPRGHVSTATVKAWSRTVVEEPLDPVAAQQWTLRPRRRCAPPNASGARRDGTRAAAPAAPISPRAKFLGPGDSPCQDSWPKIRWCPDQIFPARLRTQEANKRIFSESQILSINSSLDNHSGHTCESSTISPGRFGQLF